jgi:ribosomal protein S18 acetylase RimI-like enzyme
MGIDDEHFTMGCFTSGNQLVGIATFRRDKRQKARHKSFIQTMYVAPLFRGKRIARSLLDELIKTSQNMPGLEQIHLWVLNPETSSARDLYLKAGFLAQGPCVKRDLIIDGKYVDAEYMTLEIQE